MITILSNITMGGPFFKRTLRQLSGSDIHIPDGYNTWVQQLLSPTETLLNSQAVFLILDGEALLGGTISEGEDTIARLQSHLELIGQFFTAHPDVPLFVSSLDIPQRTISPLVGKRNEIRAMAFWREKLEDMGLPVCELAEIAANMGRDHFYSAKMWYYGSIPFSMTGEKALAAECFRCWNALRGERKKCLVLDLDNTLWGGVIGEDGLGGIQLGPTKEGAIYQNFQRRILELKQQGVLLAVVSKNNIDDALSAIRQHPDMLLREEDFVAIKANWDPKPVNIEHLGTELNLGLDSFVFIDDNPVEREAVKIVLPAVTVPDFPTDPVQLESFMRSVARDFFPILRLTQEDLKKSEQYRVERLREEEKQKFTTLDEYLDSLDMRLSIREVGEEDIPRAAQLTQKTNQFNLTTKRYTESDIRSMSLSSEWHAWMGELEDRFGKYGKVILCLAQIEGERARLDTFLMSCRVMGRGVESAFLEHVEQALARVGVTKVEAEYRITPKNSMVAEFWPQYGYRKEKNNCERKLYTKSGPFHPLYHGAITIVKD